VIRHVTADVVDATLAQIAAWREFGWELHAAVNLSMRSLHDPERPATIHLARRELRRFRYLAEVFEPVVAAITQRYLDHLQSVQGDMGHIQDATVLNATVDRYLNKHAKTADEAGSTRDILDRRRGALIEKFLRRR